MASLIAGLLVIAINIFSAFLGSHRGLYAILKTENPVVSFLTDPQGLHRVPIHNLTI